MLSRNSITRLLQNTHILSREELWAKSDEEDFRYIFTKDQTLINQYIALRKNLSRIDNKLKGFRYFSHYEKEDYGNPDKQILLIFKKSRCVGGGCFTVSTPCHRVLLPIDEEFVLKENEGSFLQKAFPELHLEKESYCELSRIVLHTDFRDGKYIRRMFSRFIDLAGKHSCKYIFGMGDAVRLRNNKNIFSRGFGMNSKIFFDIKLPQKEDFEGKKMHIMVVYTQNYRN